MYGIDVYFVPGGVANAPDDHEDDLEALELVHAFVGKSNFPQGRWVQDRCFLSFDCFGKAGVLVRLHPHGPRDTACDLSMHRQYAISVVIAHGDPNNIVEQVRRACREEVKKLGYQTLI